MDRRQLLTGLLGLTAGMLLPRRAFAQTAILSDRLLVVSSGRTNVVALSTDGGLVLVDSGTPEFSEVLVESLQQLPGGRRVRTLFNTHYHPDNTGANERLVQLGATIVAHENTRLWMATPVWVPAEDRYRAPRRKAAHPTETFRVDGSMTVRR